MPFKIRIDLVEEVPPTGRQRAAIERTLESLEIEVEDQKEGTDVMEDIAFLLESQDYDLGEDT